MRQSQLFTKTRREAPSEEVSQNAQYLIRGGYIHKEMAGVYDLLPLGLRVIEKIRGIIREEMNALGGQEVFMSTLQNPDLWMKTERWQDDKVDVWFKTRLKDGGELGLAPTHEEPITKMLTQHVSSYRDLPKSVYQFQTKFRNELRAKSGIMRGREFLMKDMYSFNRSEAELQKFYENAGVAYENVFRRVGIGDTTYLTFASGGMFARFSHEFQCVSTAGEDTIFIDTDKRIAVNEEVMTEEILEELSLKRDKLVEAKSIEVGNIFKLGTKYSDAMGLTYKAEDGTEQKVHMGCYGMGLGRIMGTIVEVLCDDKGIVWPESVAPFKFHLVELSQGDEAIRSAADQLYEDMKAAHLEVLYDDRDIRAGEKFADSDLLGIPYRIIVGKQTTDSAIEIVERKNGAKRTVSRERLVGGGV